METADGTAFPGATIVHRQIQKSEDGYAYKTTAPVEGNTFEEFELGDLCTELSTL